jgi:uncharacterized protein (DUF2141 family)
MSSQNAAALAAAWLGAFICLPVLAEAQTPAKVKVTVTVKNVASNVGTIRGQLCTDPAAFGVTTCGAARAVVPAKAGSVDLVFNDVPPGDYAFSVFHDKNNDGKTQIFSEAFAFGNDAKTLPPVYDEAVLKVTGDLKTEVTLFKAG